MVSARRTRRPSVGIGQVGLEDVNAKQRWVMTGPAWVRAGTTAATNQV